MDDDLLNRRRVAFDPDVPADFVAGSAAFVGQVYNAGAIPTTLPGQFAVHPVTVSGVESEGSAAGVTVGTLTRVVTVYGTKAPVAGDHLVARLCGGRWVAEHGGATTGGGGTGIVITGCPCTDMPATLNLTMTGTDPGGIMNPCTFTWQATPPWAPVGVPNRYWSELFDAATYGGVNNWYYTLLCGGGAYTMSRTVAPGSSAPTGGSMGNLWRWVPLFGGNTCSPFHMTTGASLAGGSYTIYNPQLNG